MPLTNKDYDEKRNFIRMFINADVTMTDPDTGTIYNGESKDLSGDGVSVKTNHEFQLNQKLEVHILTKQGTLSPLTAELQVNRVIKLDDGMFEVAGTIDQVN
jgi:hypothetical protein